MSAEYPFMAYQVLPYGTITLDIDGTEDTITLGTEGALSMGYSLAVGAAGTPAALLATALATHSYWGVSPPTLTATYESSTSLYAPRWSIGTLTLGVDAEIEVTGGDAATLACLGLVVGDTATLTTFLSPWRATRRWRGLWSPGDPAAIAEPTYIDLGEGATNPYDPAYHDRYRMSRQLVWAMDWPLVDAADISRDLVAQDPGLQSLANRETDDTEGTLDDLIGAAGSGRLLRLVLSSSDSRDVRMSDDGAYRRSEYATRETYGGRRYAVSLGLIEAAAYTGVVT